MGASSVCYGVRIGLRASSEAGLALLKTWLPGAVRPSGATVVHGLYSLILGGSSPRSRVKRFHVLYRDATRLARSLDLEEVRRAFDQNVSMMIGEKASRRVFVHAGVVGIEGRAILVPGTSFSGKTSLVHALVKEGGVYYSDEFAVLDSRGRVSAWAEPLSIRVAGARKPAQTHTPESLGIITGKVRLPVGLVVLTSFEKGRTFRPKTITAAAGTLGMIEHTLPARKRPRATLRALASAVSGARVVRGPRGEAREAARAIIRLMVDPGRA